VWTMNGRVQRTQRISSQQASSGRYVCMTGFLYTMPIHAVMHGRLCRIGFWLEQGMLCYIVAAAVCTLHAILVAHMRCQHAACCCLEE
jgi:hypothetical protein